MEPNACHHAVMTAVQRMAPTRIGSLSLGVIGAGFGLLSLGEARSAPGGSFVTTSWLGLAAELAAGWAVIAVGVVDCWLIIEMTADAGAVTCEQETAVMADAADRIGALGGELHVGHATHGMITVRADIPCES